MTSKKSKAELVAICKLEFYRKQKNWRYCPPERKVKDSKRRPKTSNAKLNQTYYIARAPETSEPSPPDTPDTEERHILNEAFVDTGTGTESDEPVQREDKDVIAPETRTDDLLSQLDPPGIPYSPKWSIQRWAERRRLWNLEPTPAFDPTCPTSDPTCPTRDQTCPTRDPTCPTYVPTCPTYDLTSPTYASKHPTLDPFRPYSDPTVPLRTYLNEDANCPIFDNNYNKIQQDVYYSNHYLNLHQKDTEIYTTNYPAQSCDIEYQEPFGPKYGVSMVYYNSNMCHQDFDVPLSGANLDIGKACEGHEDDWERCAGEGAVGSDLDWLQVAAAVGAGGEDAVDGDWHLHDLSEASIASSEFICGAALAPHSTQVDLLGPGPGPGPEPATLPPAALAAAVACHSAALRVLLAEAQRRHQLGNEPPSPPPFPASLDEVPVRDPGPALLPPTYFHERILAGSRPTPDLQGHTETAGQTWFAGHTGLAGQTWLVGQTWLAGQTGLVGQTQTEGGRGRGRLKVGIRMGRPYRL